MHFGTLIWKNLVRRPIRSGLTVFAVAISIGCVVALVGVATGFKRAFRGLYETKNLDLIVVRAGQGQRLASTLDIGLADKMRAIPGVRYVFPGLVDVISFEEQGIYGVVAQGLKMNPMVAETFKIVEGRALNEQDTKALMLGAILAKNLGKKLHDKVEIFENEFFEIVGIFNNPNVFENGSMVICLEEMQRLLDRPQHVTGFTVELEPGDKEKNIERVRNQIEAVEPGISAMRISEHADSLSELRAASAMAWLTSVLALLIGTAGVLNTMLMSVLERTKEIGIFRAIGWTAGQVVKMVLAEALMLSMLGAVVGTLGALVLVRLLTKLPMAAGFVDGHIPGYVIGQGFIIALLIGLIGGSFAALSAARLLPTTALRHE